MKPTPKALTHSPRLMSTFGLPIYVARIPAAPFASKLAPIYDVTSVRGHRTLRWLLRFSLAAGHAVSVANASA